MNENATIAALATPPGNAGLAVVRLSGDDAFKIADKLFKGKAPLADVPTHTIHYGDFVSKDALLDKVTASVFRAPNSYTGENVVEFGCHGGKVVSRAIVEALIDAGAEHASPGEFTKRAFLNGKIDLTQAEAVADLIHSISTPVAHIAARQLAGGFKSRLAEYIEKLIDLSALMVLEFDFAEEEVEFAKLDDVKRSAEEALYYCETLAASHKSAETFRAGYFVALAGFPNSGKSTLFNAILKKNRAITSETPGTTRDYLEETIYIDTFPVRLFDTAGVRDATDEIEIEGIKFVDSILRQANMIFLINDISVSPETSSLLYDELKDKYPAAQILLLQNKIDKTADNYKSSENEIYISAKTGKGIDVLTKRIANAANNDLETAKDVLVNERHFSLLKKSAKYLRSALDSLDSEIGAEIVAIDLRAAADSLAEITGEKWSDRVLESVFSKFCIGK